jgi:hypothetical protein
MEMFNFLRYSCVTLGCLVALSHCNVGNAQSEGTLFSFQEITKLETIAGDYPALPIRFGDLNAIALVDTGLPAATLLDSSLELQLAERSLLLGKGKAIILKGVGKRFKGTLFDALRLSAGDKEINLFSINSVDFQNIQKALGQNIKVVLGYEFLRRGALGYEKSSNSFYLGYKARQIEGLYSSLALSLEKGEVCADLRMPWRTADNKFMVDTGMRWPLGLKHNLFSEGVSNGSIVQVEDCFGYTIGGKEAKRFGRIPSIDVFGHQFRDVLVIEGNSNLIGLGLLKRFDFEIDFLGAQIVFQDNVDTTKPFTIDVSGISIELQEKSVVVVNNLEMAASPLGLLQAGDIVQRWDDTPANRENFEKIQSMLLEYPKVHPNRLLVVRSGELVELKSD